MRLQLLARVLLPLSALLATLGGAAEAQEVVRGTIEQVDTAQSTIVIRTERGNRPCRLTPATLIMVAGAPASLRDLRPGQRVTAQFAVTSAGAPRLEVVRLEVALR